MAGLAMTAAVFAVELPGRHSTRATGNAPLIAGAEAGSPIRPSVSNLRAGAPIVQRVVPVRSPPLRRS